MAFVDSSSSDDNKARCFRRIPGGELVSSMLLSNRRRTGNVMRDVMVVAVACTHSSSKTVAAVEVFVAKRCAGWGGVFQSK